MSCSIVIPCYDHAEFLPQAIESALAQTYPCDVVVVDDGSHDDTSLIASRYPVTLIRQDNKGLSAARNVGLASVGTEYALCLDADDWLQHDAVELMYGLDDIVCPSVLMFGAVESVWIPPMAHPTLSDFTEANFCICASLIRSEVFHAVSFDEAMRDGGEDWDFWTRAVFAGFSVTVVADKLLHYRRHAEDRSQRPNSSERLRAKHDEVTAYMQAKWKAMGIHG